MKSWIKKHKIMTIIISILTLILIANIVIYYANYYDVLENATITNKNYHIIIPNAFAIWDGFIQEGATSVLQFIFPLVVMIPGVYKFYQYQKSGMFKHIIIKEDYNKYIMKQVLNCWKYALIVPIFLCISFIVCCFLSKFQFNYITGSPLGLAPYTTLLENIIYIIIKIINLGLASIFCINIGIIFIKKGYNFLVVILLSFLSIFIYQVIMELVIGRFITDITGNLFFVNGITLFGFWYYDNGVNNINTFFYALSLFSFSTFLVILAYKNKEKVIIDEEK